MGFTTFLLLAMMAGGNGRLDVVGMIPAREYFKARDIDPTIEKLVELAGDSPSSGKKQIAQLLALRQLASEVESVKKSPKFAEVRQLLRQISEGKKANDSSGFAADYAKRALLALEGGTDETTDSAGWNEGAAWIPKSVCFFSGLDSRGTKPGRQRLPDLNANGMLPRGEKERLFDGIDKVGNVRIDRIVIGIGQLENNNFEMFVRVTGKANSSWLAEAFKGEKVEDRDGGAGPKIRVIRLLYPNGRGPAMALVGDTDFLLAGIETTKPRALGGAAFVQAADTTSLDKMLALVAKPGPNATQGDIKGDLASIPAKAGAVAVGQVSSWLGSDAPFPMPRKIFAYALRTADGFDVQMKATMADKDMAKKLTQTIDQARDSALAQLKKEKDRPQPIPGANLNSIMALLEGIKAKSEVEVVQVQMHVSLEAIMNITVFVAGR